MKAKNTYGILSLLLNAIAIFVFGYYIIGKQNDVFENESPYRIALYGFCVSLFFSFVDLLLGFAFRDKLDFDEQKLRKKFVLQLLFFALYFISISLYVFFKR